MSATYTGVSYFITAILLAAPYFFTGSMIFALSSSMAIAVVILALTTYYSTVVSTKPFLRDFGEILAILFAVAVALYVFGYVVHIYLLPGITV